MADLFVGVNLRQDDVQDFINACKSVNIDPTTIPINYTLHDDTEAITDASIQAALNAKLDVRLWRCYSPNSRIAPGRIPSGSNIVGWNEADDSSAYPNLPGWVDGWWQFAKSLGLVVHYGAPNVDGYLLDNDALMATLDIVDRHIGATFSPPPATLQGKPVWVTEIDVDPNYPETYSQLIPCAQRCIAAGIPAFLWGMDPFQPDAATDTNILTQIVQINKGIVATPKTQAEDAYNTLTGGKPMVPGVQYVQYNNNSTYTTVVTFSNLQDAQNGYNKVTGGKPFIVGDRYVQADGDGTYKVVVTYPLG